MSTTIEHLGINQGLSCAKPDWIDSKASPSDHIEQIRKFNVLAGNTDNTYNVRQAALYFGLQLEEMAEKLDTVVGDTEFEQTPYHLDELIDQINLVADQFKHGEFDKLFERADRKMLLDDDVDQFVVTVGSMLSMGADVHGAIAEVNRANLAKVFPDGTLHKNPHGKIIKPEGWTGPNLSEFVCGDTDHE